MQASAERYRKVWSTRRSSVMELIDSMAEGMEKRPKELFTMFGLETDEEHKVSLKDFKV